jgi:hypothetical protein
MKILSQKKTKIQLVFLTKWGMLTVEAITFMCRLRTITFNRDRFRHITDINLWNISYNTFSTVLLLRTASQILMAELAYSVIYVHWKINEKNLFLPLFLYKNYYPMLCFAKNIERNKFDNTSSNKHVRNTFCPGSFQV